MEDVTRLNSDLLTNALPKAERAIRLDIHFIFAGDLCVQQVRF